MSAAIRLATYGTLAPGRSNAHQLADLDGAWLRGLVHGHLIELSYGPGRIFPGILLDPGAGAVEVHILQSRDLPAHWPRLDAFEGPRYRRVVTSALTPGGLLAVSIYEAVA